MFSVRHLDAMRFVSSHQVSFLSQLEVGTCGFAMDAGFLFPVPRHSYLPFAIFVPVLNGAFGFAFLKVPPKDL